MIAVSDRAKRLVEALHEPFSNEQRWQIAQEFLDEERNIGCTHCDCYLYPEEGSAKLARQSGLNPEAPKGVESSNLSPSSIEENKHGPECEFGCSFI